ncbi:MAG: apolipoprotein N-acyltransferase, partial [Pararhodobacter sp.]|nr:apolipoprotein N-acyltransferase [Pararhodobacter sp.]
GAWGWGALGPVGAGQGIAASAGAAEAPLRLRLVQPNATQALKWDPRYAEVFFRRHLELSAAPSEDGPAPDLVIWPETAVPFLLDRPGNGLELAAEATGGAPLILGIQRSEPGQDGGARRYFNSLAVLGPAGVAQAVYDKHHLVPFGEYMPVLGRFADRLGAGWAGGIASQVLMGYDAGPGPQVLDLGAAGLVLPLICYEAIFPRNLRTQERPDWLLQITNDAWFGVRIGPFQHLAQARLRAVEQGLPLVRVANTGVSAVIDARGRLMDSLGMDREGFIDADLPPALPATAYARMGDAPWHLVLGLALLLAAIRRLGNRH